ncbi:MAG: hypothetical protein ACFFF4_01875 [Candidatus Thorarchaeota archaeon]
MKTPDYLSAITFSAISGAILLALKSFFDQILGFGVYELEIAFTWSLTIFVVIPVIVKESKLLGQHMKNKRPQEMTGRFSVIKYSILGYLLGIMVSIVPYSYHWRDHVTSLLSLTFYIDQIIARRSIYDPFSEYRIIFGTHSYITGYAFLFSLLFNIYFCISLLGYFKGNEKRRRVLLIGFFYPLVILLNSAYNFYSGIFDVFPIPLPILLITGLLLMKKIPVVPGDDSVWVEETERVWYEEPKVMQDDGMVYVKVPLKYRITSIMKRAMGVKKVPHSKDNNEDLFADE